MHLIGVKEEDGWIFSRWELTYPTGWLTIQKGVAAAYDYYDRVEILSGDERVDVKGKEEIYDIPEDRCMIIRGYSTIIKAPVMIRFYNQLRDVDVNVPADGEEFGYTDYEKFNHSLCEYLDSIEIAMFT